MYGNYSPLNGYSSQPSVDRINNQIAELEKMKAQMQPNQNTMPANINQTFQLAPSNQGNIKYVNSVEDVTKEFVYSDTPFFSKDLTTMWLKNAKGDIKTFNLQEVVEKDEKDLMIEQLQAQISTLMKEVNNNAKPINDNANEPVEEPKPTNVRSSRTSKK